MIKTIYLNIEDDVQTIVQKVARMDATSVVLVFPKRSYVFADPINLKLLKKQTDMLGKEISLLTMDEVGQIYAREAGFAIKTISNAPRQGLSDIRSGSGRPAPSPVPVFVEPPVQSTLETQTTELKPRTRIVRRKKSSTIPQPFLLVKETKYPETAEHGKSHRAVSLEKPRRRTFWKVTFGFLLPVILVLALVALFVLPQGKVIVYPKTDSVVRDIEVTAGTEIGEVDTSKMLLPAIKVIKTLSLQDTFQSTGKKEVGTKAEGKIRIINLTGKPINLRASTTVLTLGNKNYQFLEDQNNIKAIPPTQLQTGKYQPTVVDVVAAAGGEDYNVPAGTRLEITNQVFGSQPQVLYAKTETALLGGTSRFLSVVGEDDFKNAQSVLVGKMISQIRNDLASQNLQLPDKAYTAEVVDFLPDKAAGTESPSFTVSLKATIKGLAVNQDQLESLVEGRIIKSLPENEKLINSLSGSLDIKTKNLNFDTGLAVLNIHVEARSSAQVKLDGLEQELLGKSKQEVSDVLLARSDIEKIDIILSPYWQRSMPKFATKIKLELAN